MNTFANYILEENDLSAKFEIAYYLSKKIRIFFDKSVVFKTEIARMFIDYMKIDVDKNLVLTACLLCNCKKVNDAQDIKKVHTYAKEGAEYLETLGFDKKFCKICEEINRYSQSNPREKESDILELVDQFGGMLLDRPERIGFKPDEAMVLLEHRNLKDYYNRYLHTFNDFVNIMEEVELNEMTTMKSLRRLVKIYNETDKLKNFLNKVCYDYEPKIDKAMEKHLKEVKDKMLEDDSKIPLFSQETARKVLLNMQKEELRNI